MKACWTEREVNFDGRLWQLQGASMEPKPRCNERVEQNQLRTGVLHGTDAGATRVGRAREDVF